LGLAGTGRTSEADGLIVRFVYEGHLLRIQFMFEPFLQCGRAEIWRPSGSLSRIRNCLLAEAWLGFGQRSRFEGRDGALV
jgi:hypothetical protein